MSALPRPSAHQLATRIVLGIGRRLRHVLKPIFSNFVTVYARERIVPRRGSLLLNLGCGEHRLDGFVNIDHRNTQAADVICDITRLPYCAASVRRIEAYHVIEHLPFHRAVATLRHWLELLEPGGTLVLECPDFDAAVREYVGGNSSRLGNIFGLQRFRGDFHLWGWNSERLSSALTETGFVNVRTAPATDYHRLSEPCIRIEGEKPTHG